jgi:hypothetical protein
MRITASPSRLFVAVMAVTLFIAACDRDRPAPAQPQPPTAPAPPPAPVAVELKDVIEQDSRFIVGITYPPGMAKYPGLAEALRAYSDTARATLDQALAKIDAAKQVGPYDLTLTYTLLAETPDVVAVSAGGAVFTGGAHAEPLVARFVWLPRENRLLTASALVPDPKGWVSISDHVREQLHAELSQRIDSDELPPAERAQLIRTTGKMIDAGTKPTAEAFAMFEPVLAPEGGKLVGLKFVFPPYQVGPYVDGERTVEVPTSVLRPHLSPAFAPMFVDSPAPMPAEAAAAAAKPAGMP